MTNFGNSFYIFDESKFVNNYKKFASAFRDDNLQFQVAYAMKANYMPLLPYIIAKQNGLVEVVSLLEYKIAEKYIKPEHIIFNGPAKTKESLLYALKNNSIVNIDTKVELNYILDLIVKKKIKKAEIGIRISFKLKRYKSRFGFSIESQEFNQVLERIKSENRIQLVSIHSHFSTKERSLELFEIRAKEMCKAYLKLRKDFPIRFINIGGGFFGECDSVLKSNFPFAIPSWKQYSSVIRMSLQPLLMENEIPIILLEPGIALVGNTMALYAKVIEIKKNNTKCIAVCDTNINVVNPTKSNIKPKLEIIHKESCNGNKDINEYKVVGNTCMENDIICDNYIGNLKAGDYIKVPNRGAYSNVFTPNFIMPAPGIFSKEGKLIKSPDSIESILSNYRILEEDNL